MIKIILSIYYNPVDQIKNIIETDVKNIYVPINSGSILRGDKWCDQWLKYDDTGDNISSKNRLLNEMTAIYWFWKHLDEYPTADYIGFNHYRRLFRLNDLSDYSNYDLIVMKPIFTCPMPYSLAWQYSKYHVIQDLQICCDVLKTINPIFHSEFVDYLNGTGENFAPCNMFLMKRHMFEEWCPFIFQIYPILEKRIDLSGRDNYQKRAFAFLTERIFGFWCKQKMNLNYKVKQITAEEHLDWKNNKLNERGTYD